MKNSVKRLNYPFINKYIFYGLYLGTRKTFWNREIQPFLKGFRNNFAVFVPDLSLLYFRRAFLFLIKILLSGKKILFVGCPLGLEKDFVSLCSFYNHYIIDRVPRGFFTNFNKIECLQVSNLKERPSLVFLFSTSANPILLKEATKLDIPVMAFVSSEDEVLGVDYPLPGNICSTKGSFFVYNMFFHLFKTYRSNS